MDDYELSSIRPRRGDEVLCFTGLGMQARQFKQLRYGQLPIDKTLDLHGMTLQEANGALARCLDHAYALGRRVVLMIHGKGGSQGSVIKGLVAKVLSNDPRVLAYVSACAQDGGTGALYCLLKRQR